MRFLQIFLLSLVPFLVCGQTRFDVGGHIGNFDFAVSNYYRVPEREVVRAHLASRGIGCFTHLGYSPEAFPAEATAGDGLALPIYPELTSDQQQHVIDSLAECVA